MQKVLQTLARNDVPVESLTQVFPTDPTCNYTKSLNNKTTDSKTGVLTGAVKLNV